MEGARQRYGTRDQNPDAYRQLDHELDTIEALDFPGYFLIVHDIVDFCRRENIYCQARGSAANSAVCYALGINVDAVRWGLLFERFHATTWTPSPPGSPSPGAPAPSKAPSTGSFCGISDLGCSGW
jgi:DNA polymerase III alpha subunit